MLNKSTVILLSCFFALNAFGDGKTPSSTVESSVKPSQKEKVASLALVSVPSSGEAPSLAFVPGSKNPVLKTHDEVLRLLSRSFNGQLVTEIFDTKSMVIRGQARVRFQDNTFDLFFEISKNAIIYRIPHQGTSLSNFDFSKNSKVNCLDVTIILSSKVSHLHWIKADKNCGLPEKRKGTFLLNFSDELNLGHYLHSSTLTDASIVKCSKIPGSHAILAFLQLMKNGKSWYEQYDYRSGLASQAEYDEVKTKLTQASLTAIRATFTKLADERSSPETQPYRDHLSQCDSHLKEFDQLETEFRSIYPGEDRLGKFITWVWEKDCSKYFRMMRVLFQSKPNDNQLDTCGAVSMANPKLFPWINSYEDFLIYTSIMEKKYFTGYDLYRSH